MGFGKSLKRVIGGGAAIGGAVFGGPIGGAVGGAVGARIAGVSAAKGALGGMGAALAIPAIGAAASSLGGLGGLKSAGMAAVQRLGVPGFSSAGVPPPSLPAAAAMSIPDYGPMAGGIPAMLPAAWPGGAAAAAPGVGGPFLAAPVAGAVAQLGAAAARMGTRVWSATLGRWISGKMATRYTKLIGINAAAAILGVGALELAQSVLTTQSRARGRGRGITAAAMRTTIRTMGKVERLHARIAAAARTHVGRSAGYRRGGRGAVHVRTAPVTHLS